MEVHPLFASLPGGSGHVVQITHPLVKVRRNAKTPEEKGGNIVVKIQVCGRRGWMGGMPGLMGGGWCGGCS